MIVCDCVECYENRLLEVLEGPVAIYKSMNYRIFNIHCLNCYRDHPPKEFHSDPCPPLDSLDRANI